MVLTVEVPAMAVITITVGVRHDSGVMDVTRGDAVCPSRRSQLWSVTKFILALTFVHFLLHTL